MSAALCSTAAVAVGAQEVMGLRDSSKFNTAHQAGVRDPDRPSPTSITSFFDCHVISFIQALHERHLRHRPCPGSELLQRPNATLRHSLTATTRRHRHSHFYNFHLLSSSKNGGECCDQVTPAASSQQPAASSNQAQQPAGASACTCAACTALKGAHPSSLSHQI